MQRIRVLTAVLLLLSAVAFAAGALAERRAAGAERPATAVVSAPPTSAEHVDADGGEGAPAPATVAEGRETSGSRETVGGVNLEAPGLALGGVLLGLLLAAAVLGLRSPLVPLAVAAGMTAFLALDAKEVAHQLNESRGSLALLAGIVALLHLAAGAAAGVLARQERRTRADLVRGVSPGL